MSSTLARRTRRAAAPWWGLGVAVALMVLAMAVPAVTGWNVRVNSFPPLHAEWDPRVGWATLPAVLLAVLASLRAVDVAERIPWRRLLLATFVAGLAWMLVLALVDGSRGVGAILDDRYEYLRTARRTTDLHATLQEYVSRIPYSAIPRNWPVHVAGHPAGALVFFVALVRLDLGSGLAAGLVVTVLAATTAVAVLVTARTLGAERLARRAAPFLAFGPAAVWQSVSADAMFAATAAWGVACLALAATRRSIAWSVLSGLLLGYAVMLSYGLPLLAVLAVAVLAVARSWFPLALSAAAALAVVLAFALLGFSYLEALPAIHERYWEAVGGRRPESYWLWGNLAALAFSAGPLAAAAVANLLADAREHLRDPQARVVLWLSGAGAAMVVLADVSLMSKAEVERIWLPFVPWLLLSCALLPERWRRGGLVLQVALALVVQHLLDTGW
jgi:methylthioxylose transferase